ncbi:hypothetical protein RDWZM_001145 [Blomia tropicalis]|uniref:Ribonuclease 3 n=1 Tax=Blomia tropicalis TaxID=40697 RepID=A0A9Q0MB32_BLOTA|nr:hypothetical protein RDWZM_001145 [Blomia tropicalis]
MNEISHNKSDKSDSTWSNHHKDVKKNDYERRYNSSSSSSRYNSKKSDKTYRNRYDHRSSSCSSTDRSQFDNTSRSNYDSEYNHDRKRSRKYDNYREPSSKRVCKDELAEIFNSDCAYKRSIPLAPYYTQSSVVTDDNRILSISKFARSQKTPFSFPQRQIKFRAHIHHHDEDLSCDSESGDELDDDTDSSFQELQRKKSHPWRLHDELWYNDKGEVNDGPVCRCSLKAQKSGIRHGIYLGEEPLPRCNPNTDNRDRLYHYFIKITPTTNLIVDSPTVIEHDSHSYYFEGYSLFSHFPIFETLPPCKVIRFNIEYTISLVEDDFPQNFCIGDIDHFFDYIFYELLELADLDFKAKGDTEGCNRFHFMPRFVRLLKDNGKELLSMSVILEYLYKNSNPLIDCTNLDRYANMSIDEWNNFTKQHKGTIVTNPGMKPCTIRIDQIDRESSDLKSEANTSGSSKVISKVESKSEIETNVTLFDEKIPVLVHFGIRPPQLSYAGNPMYQKAWRDYVKYRHLLANKEKVSFADKQILCQKEERLQELRSKSDLKRDVTVVVSSKGFYRTGLQCDIVQHSLLVPVLVCHLRFHCSLQHLEQLVGYSFKDRTLLQLALTHPSYRVNFGTNPDHARNTLTNCGPRNVEYGDRKVHFVNTRKRGINMLINIMSRFGCNEETVSNIHHNERLEFLGDAVVEFLTTIHLYYLFPDLEEGGLATYRAALVQNQHLAVLAKKLQLEKFMLYAHGSDLCHDLELKHAMANCFEAFMGALFLDGGIMVADKVLSRTLFEDDTEENRSLYNVWVNLHKHPLQSQYPDGDRQFIDTVPRLKELNKFEELIGIQFVHIRLLARAFTHRSVGYNNLTLGSNQRMEFLGDTVLQLVASEYLYKFFPDHHEGHLSLLRSSLVNNKTQAVVCDDLGIASITQYNTAKAELKTKDRADLLEAFLGALYVDKGFEFCRVFCEVCFFPRLEDFIMNQDWNDPKSKLQQCCLTLRSATGGEPDIPIYKVIESKGPTNTRIYVVAVYFRDERLATGNGHSIQEAEMNAATNALTNSSKKLFPHLAMQKRIIEKRRQEKKIFATLNHPINRALFGQNENYGPSWYRYLILNTLERNDPKFQIQNSNFPSLIKPSISLNGANQLSKYKESRRPMIHPFSHDLQNRFASIKAIQPIFHERINSIRDCTKEQDKIHSPQQERIQDSTSKMSNEKMSNEKMSNEKMSNEKMSNEKMSNEKMNNEKMSDEQEKKLRQISRNLIFLSELNERRNALPKSGKSNFLSFQAEGMANPYDEIRDLNYVGQLLDTNKRQEMGVKKATTSTAAAASFLSNRQEPKARRKLIESEPSMMQNDHELVLQPKAYQQSIDSINRKDSILNSMSDIYFVAIVACVSSVAIFSVIGAGYCFYKVQQSNKAAQDVEFPAYGVIGPTSRTGANNGKCTSPPSDRKLAQNAQMYHYHQQKQQMISTEKNANIPRHTINGSDIESDEENEDGEYTVYECPGLAPTGEMEVKNPLFQDDLTPITSPSVNGLVNKQQKESPKEDKVENQSTNKSGTD